MSVLKKIGIFLAGAGADITKILGFPFISQLLGLIPGKLGQTVTTIAGDLNQFAGFASMAEAMYPSIAGAKTGSAKLTAATPLVEKALLLWAQDNLPGHSKLLVSPEVFSADAGAFMSTFVKIMNDFGE
jgi:hypothetical protein